jgi:hypothetical protein
MKMPWTNRQGPAKLIAVCATVLLVAGGLCGVQIGVFLSAGRLAGNHANINNITDALIPVFIFTGLAELAAVLLCLIGLVIGVIWKILKPREENRD